MRRMCFCKRTGRKRARAARALKQKEKMETVFFGLNIGISAFSFRGLENRKQTKAKFESRNKYKKNKINIERKLTIRTNRFDRRSGKSWTRENDLFRVRQTQELEDMNHNDENKQYLPRGRHLF